MWRCMLHEHLPRRQSTLRSGCEPQNNNAAIQRSQWANRYSSVQYLPNSSKISEQQALDRCESAGSSVARKANCMSFCMSSSSGAPEMHTHCIEVLSGIGLKAGNVAPCRSGRAGGPRLAHVSVTAPHVTFVYVTGHKPVRNLPPRPSPGKQPVPEVPGGFFRHARARCA